MTATFWIATAQTVVFLALCGWAWWHAGVTAETNNAARQAAEHAQAGAQHATRAALDARAMLDDARDWLVDMREWMAGDPEPQQPSTEPMRKVGVDTEPANQRITPRAITQQQATAPVDPWVQEQMAEINRKLGIDQPEPTKATPRKTAAKQPVKRTGSTASGRGKAT